MNIAKKDLTEISESTKVATTVFTIYCYYCGEVFEKTTDSFAVPATAYHKDCRDEAMAKEEYRRVQVEEERARLKDPWSCGL